MSPERWSQEAKNAPETRRQGKPIIVPVATSLWASAAALLDQQAQAFASPAVFSTFPLPRSY